MLLIIGFVPSNISFKLICQLLQRDTLQARQQQSLRGIERLGQRIVYGSLNQTFRMIRR